ncbi:hypothetical protein PHLCEN_2v7105 [Hermanssonia centrifuga]|uniref:Uncharacterized protein n=1 Tax=Hermanssonia centrifuga TaxID=98765 RepID=A0A2R6NXI0_9APHY|nr:hypothetical protein PHLCEN_2v7105 [Hermanssonia centrifuga]
MIIVIFHSGRYKFLATLFAINLTLHRTFASPVSPQAPSWSSLAAVAPAHNGILVAPLLTIEISSGSLNGATIAPSSKEPVPLHMVYLMPIVAIGPNTSSPSSGGTTGMPLAIWKIVVIILSCLGVPAGVIACKFKAPGVSCACERRSQDQEGQDGSEMIDVSITNNHDVGRLERTDCDRPDQEIRYR